MRPFFVLSFALTFLLLAGTFPASAQAQGNGFGVDGSAFPTLTFGAVPLPGGTPFSPVGPTTANRQGGDFGPGGRFYTMQDNDLVAISPADAETSPIGPVTGISAGHTVIAMTYNALLGTMYLGSTDLTNGGSNLYTLDLGTGAATLVGPLTNVRGLLALAANCGGRLFGIDAQTDNLVRINPTTAATSVVGPLGVDADLVAQDADFHPKTGTLYWTQFSGESGELYRVDFTSGAAESITTWPQDFISFGIEGTCAGTGFIDFNASGPGTLGAATDPFPSIQSAFDAGATELLIVPGTYDEDVTLTGQNGQFLTLTSWNGAADENQAFDIEGTLSLNAFTLTPGAGVQARKGAAQSDDIFLELGDLTDWDLNEILAVDEGTELGSDGTAQISADAVRIAGIVRNAALEIDGETEFGGLFKGKLFTTGDVVVRPDADLRLAQLFFRGFRQNLLFDTTGRTDAFHICKIAMQQSSEGRVGNPYLRAAPFFPSPLADPRLAFINDTTGFGNGLMYLNNTQLTTFNIQRDVDEGHLSHVVGTLTRPIVPGETIFPIGSLTQYAPFDVTMSAPPADLQMTASLLNTRPPGTAGFPIDGIPGPADSHWFIASSTPFNMTGSDALGFLGGGFTDFTDVEDIRLIRRLAGDEANTWVSPEGTYNNTLTPSGAPLVRLSSVEDQITSEGLLYSFLPNTSEGFTNAVIVNTFPSDAWTIFIGDTPRPDAVPGQGAGRFSLDVETEGTDDTATFDFGIAPAGSTDRADVINSIALDVASGANIVLFIRPDIEGTPTFSPPFVPEDRPADPATILLGFTNFLTPVIDVAVADVQRQDRPGDGFSFTFEDLAPGETSALNPVPATELAIDVTNGEALLSAILDLSAARHPVVFGVVMPESEGGPNGKRDGEMLFFFDLAGNLLESQVVTATHTDAPDAFALAAPYPNPFPAATTFRFTLERPAPVHLTVYDVTGKAVATLLDAPLSAATHRVPWTPQGLSSGVYLYRLQVGETVRAGKVVYVR